ncbi:uncharacterized protein LOC109861136 [Pseudomyrmex gracilis]|uniref:uncharacterized protein LOC109861136 n=1 Tax=Pseudomyrmex gracilis TaxID=219809 RepID=UPI000995A506|nr:uncharacterized protein LOC109861136 [Pseudomyrmex gracilis]
MRTAKEKVKLQDLGITDTRVRRDVGGGILIEIPGTDGAEKAERLKNVLSPVLEDACTEPEEVKKALALGEFGVCTAADIRTGPLREGRGRTGVMWVKCPFVVAEKAATVGKIRVGWTRAHVTLLPGRRLQCYKCMEFGHVRAVCPNEEDFSKSCYRCGGNEHVARDSGHRAGGAACRAKMLGGYGSRGRRIPAEETNAVRRAAVSGQDVGCMPMEI